MWAAARRYTHWHVARICNVAQAAAHNLKYMYIFIFSTPLLQQTWLTETFMSWQISRAARLMRCICIYDDCTGKSGNKKQTDNTVIVIVVATVMLCRYTCTQHRAIASTCDFIIVDIIMCSPGCCCCSAVKEILILLHVACGSNSSYLDNKGNAIPKLLAKTEF